MKSVVISTQGLKKSSKALGQYAAEALSQQTRFADLPLQARLLLAVSRVRGTHAKVPIAERYVLDTLGRIIDAGNDRQQTIDAVNLLTQVLLVAKRDAQGQDEANPEWLSSAENLILCVLCKVRDGQHSEAAQLAKYLLTDTPFEQFGRAASTLCNAECFKRAGTDVFTPSWSKQSVECADTKLNSVTHVQQLTLGELLLLNTLRLRMRTLRYSRISSTVIPMLRSHLALPKIESLVDAHLVEALQYFHKSPDIRCLCCLDISVDEALFLSLFSSYGHDDHEGVQQSLNSRLPQRSTDRLMARHVEFKTIVGGLGIEVPQRKWDYAELDNLSQFYRPCDHFSEAAVAH